MANAEIKFPTVSEDAEKGNISSGRYINGILEQSQDGRVLRKRAPGLRRFVTPVGSYTKCRGMIPANAGTLLVVYDDVVEAITGNGSVAATLGALPGEDTVTLARNNAAVPDIVCVSPSSGAFTLSASGAPSSYPDVDVGSPLSVCAANDYFVFCYGSGLLRATGLNTTAINTLDAIQVATTNEGLLRAVYHGGVLYACGPSVIQPFQIDTNPSPVGFPFLPSSTTIQRGLASTNAIAGWEGHFTSRLMFAGSDNIVYALNGYDPTRVSTHAIEHDLQNLADKTNLRAYVFMNNGHPYWVLKCDQWAWVYDLLTSTWQERESYGRTTFRAEQSAYMWGDWLLGDDVSGYLFRPDEDVYREDNSPLVWSIESQTFHSFPNRVSIPRADFMFAPGHGLITGDSATDGDPTVLISWSNDGGATFGNPLERPLGKGGIYRERITVNRTGQAGPQGKKFRLQVSDPVYIAFAGGTMEVIQDQN